MNLNKQKIKHSFPAFTVMEITIVLALTGLLMSLFFGALNRFNIMIANEGKIKTELNEWFKIRSTIWRDLDQADSIIVTLNTAICYQQQIPIEYKIESSKLSRTKSGTTIYFPIETNGISKENDHILFNFEWKDDEMHLKYPLKVSKGDEINAYFKNQKWK